MIKKKIGLYLEAKPSAGGIFQYALSVIDALNNLDKKQFEVHYFVKNDSWHEYFTPQSKIHKTKDKLILKALGRIHRRLFSINKVNKYAYLFNHSIKQINQSKCELVIYPSQDTVAYQTKRYSLTTIHDLMHRYEPHFVEYQGGVYESREIHYTNICENSNGILVDSNMGKNHVLESYKIDSDKIFVLPFVPPFHLKMISPINIIEKYNLNKNFIFFPAQFWAHKNHEILIRAFKLLIKKNIDLQLILVGSQKNNYKTIVQLIQELNLTTNVKILGYVSDEELVSLYKHSLAMVFPSLLGPTNIPPVEALLLECPLLVSNAYAMPEQVGEGALTFNPKDKFDIANKIEQVYQNSDLRLKLINKGKIQINKWTKDDFNRRLSEIIEILTEK